MRPQKVSPVSRPSIRTEIDWAGPGSWTRCPVCCLLTFRSETFQSLPPGRVFAPSFIHAAVFLSTKTIELSPRVWNGFVLFFYSSLSFSHLFMQMHKRQTWGQKSHWQLRTKREISVCAYKTSPFSFAVCVPGLHLRMKLNLSLCESSKHQTLHLHGRPVSVHMTSVI